MSRLKQHYELIRGTTDQYKKVDHDGNVSYQTYTFYPANRTMVLNR